MPELSRKWAFLNTVSNASFWNQSILQNNAYTVQFIVLPFLYTCQFWYFALKEAIRSTIKLNFLRDVLCWKFWTCSKRLTGIIIFGERKSPTIWNWRKTIFISIIYISVHRENSDNLIQLKYRFCFGQWCITAAYIILFVLKRIIWLLAMMLQNIHTGALFMPVYFNVSATSWIAVQFTENKLIILTEALSVLPQSGIWSCYVLWLAATCAFLCQMLGRICKHDILSTIKKLCDG